MKKCLQVALVCAAAGLLWLAYTVRLTSETPQAALRITPLLRELGVVRQASTSEVLFELSNTRSDTVRIVDVISQCDCTSEQVSREEIKPGDTAELKVTWISGARRGEVSTDVLVLWIPSEKKMQTTRLRITATVRPDFLFSPGELEFQFGEDDEQVVTFRPGAMGKVALTEAYTTHRAFTAELRPETSEVCVTFDSSQWAELSKDAGLVVWLDSPNQPECRIPIDVSETRDGTRH